MRNKVSFVMIVSGYFAFITAQSQGDAHCYQVTLLPLIAGVSYEIIKLWQATVTIPVVNLLSKPECGFKIRRRKNWMTV